MPTAKHKRGHWEDFENVAAELRPLLRPSSADDGTLVRAAALFWLMPFV